MGMRDKWKEFRFRLKVFIWFLTTEPWRQLKEIGRLLYKVVLAFYNVVLALNKAVTWIYISLIAMIIFLVVGNNYAAGLFLIFLLFLIIMWEWQRGYFMHKYRQEVIRKVKEQAKKEGLDSSSEEKNGNNNRIRKD
jgi:hypothetical protein